MAVTHTRTHVHITFADPYLICGNCRRWVTGYHDAEQCGCDSGTWNVPCECAAYDVTSVCPSWGPVDGCTCAERFGKVEHGKPTGPFPEGVQP